MTINSRIEQTVVATILFIAIFCLFTAAGLVSALFVDMASELETTVAVVGQLLTISATVWGLGALPVGPFSDRFGRKTMVVFGLFISGIGYLGYGFSPGFASLVAFSFVIGIGGSFSGPQVLAAVGDYFKPEVHGRMMGVVNTGSSLSYLVGVPGGALVASYFGWRSSMFLLGSLTICIAVLGIFLLPSNKPKKNKDRLSFLASIKKVISYKHFLTLMLANIVRNGAICVVITYMAAFLKQSYNLTMNELAPLLSIIAIGQVAGMLAGGQMADRFNKNKLIAGMLVVIGVFGPAFIFSSSFLWLTVFLGMLFAGVCFASTPTFFSITVSVTTDQRGTVMGIQGLSNHFGRSLGALVGGVVLTLFNYDGLGYVCAVLSIFSAFIHFSIAADKKMVHDSQ